eukprot:c20214_g1_i1.p1 GENE.c20214_g1_i1~~c20214_g1_i1.p1  ORF type:complete len:996 (-),score=301.47 c20214_g1_i1:161-3148(-)
MTEKNTDYFLLTPEQALKELGTSLDGLSEQEAQERLAKYGPNELPSDPPTPFWKLVLEQFDDHLVKILLAAAVTSFVLALFEKSEDQIQAFTEPAVILTILILNAIVGVVQESNAEAAIEALKEYESVEATVTRGGKTAVIHAKDLVPGDIVECDVGTKVPADVRVLRILTSTVTVDQSVLTGESVAVSKSIAGLKSAAVNQDKINTMFSGTDITRGKAVGVVFATGPATEIGKINKSLSEDDKQKTPLQIKLDEFGEMLSKVIMVICIAVWLINIGHFNDPVHGGSWVKGAIYYFKIAVALAVAAIPEGLPAVVTTCLALGTRKMAQKNAIVRSLPSVETLGCTSVICSDKTGTLTTNKMSVQRVAVLSKSGELDELTVAGTDYTPKGDIKLNNGPGSHLTKLDAFGKLAQICALCNESRVVFNKETRKYDRIGEPTEAALKVLVEKLGPPEGNQQPKDEEDAADMAFRYWSGQVKKDNTLEFTRERKSMSVLVSSKTDSSKRWLLVKGAPENVLARSKKVMRNDGSIAELSAKDREVFSAKLNAYGTGELTLRCLGIAYVENPPKDMNLTDTKKFEEYESDMVFVGVVGMMDPPRPEVKEAIETCHTAGIRVIVITGDNKATAESICKSIGIFQPGENLAGRSYTGQEFDALSLEEQKKAVLRASLFARTEPAHKKRLVELLQQQGQVCAMTGDGVNDAPALKKADIGIAMGSGTAVAKAAGSMVLADDNFATIVVAVEQGRAIFSNTKQFIRYLISSNIGEVACIFLTAALGLPESLIPVQLLWVNLVTDGLPATALGFNKPDKDIMKIPPRNSKEGIVDSWLFFRYLVIGVYVGIATVGGFVWWYMYAADGPHVTFHDLSHWNACTNTPTRDCSVFSGVKHHTASTISLSILVTVEMFNAANALSENQSVFVQPIWTNMWLVLAIALSFALHFVILYVPAVADIFQVVPLTKDQWGIVFAWSAPVLVIDELLKLISRARGRGQKQFVKKDQ